MKKYLILSLAFLAFLQCANAATSAVGAVDMREARVNLCLEDSIKDFSQTANYTAECSPAEKPDAKISGYATRMPSRQNGRTMEIVFENLTPNTLYSYTVLGDKGAKLFSGAFKTKPDFKDRTPPPDFAFVLLGSNYVNDKTFDPPFRTPGGEYEIYETVKSFKPDFAIWADGLDALRNADANSESGVNSRYRTARNAEKIQNILEAQPNYAVMSAAAFGKNFPDSSSQSAKYAKSAFKNFWANPDSAVEGVSAYTFEYSDAQFFVLDDCSARSNLDYRKDRPYILGDAQLRWLKTALENSTAKFKIIVVNSPFSNPSKSKSNFTFAADERKELLDFLTLKKIGGVIFLSANKTYGEVTRLVRAGAYPIIDVTAAPLTARPAEEANEMNYFRVPSSTVTSRAFAQIKIDGTENARALTVTFIDAKGKTLFTTTVKESELYKFE